MRTIGVMGLGSIGLRHARNLISLGVQVVGFDPDARRRAILVEAGGNSVGQRDAVIERADAVIVSSPTVCHIEDLRVCVSKRLHVLIEKPIGHLRDDVAELLCEAKANNVEIFTGFNLRFHPCVVSAKDLLDGGAIGRPVFVQVVCASYLPDWRPNTDYRMSYASDPVTGGVIFDMSHEIDLALHLFGPAHVASALATRTGLLDMPSEDLAEFVLVHDGGARSSLHLDYVTRPPSRMTRVFGTGGRLDIDLLARRLIRFARDTAVVDDKAFSGSFDVDYISEMSAFLRQLDGRPPAQAVGDGTLKFIPATGDDGLKSLEIALEVRARAGLPLA